LNPGSRIFAYQTTLSEEPTVTYRASFAARQSEFDRYPPIINRCLDLGPHQSQDLLINGQKGAAVISKNFQTPRLRGYVA
jgi:hypothetical protein